MVAMAGQFLTGDKGSTSFAVGTIMVVAVAMLGSLTALPAMLALLGRHVDKGRIRIPFLRRRSPPHRVPHLGRHPRPGAAPAGLGGRPSSLRAAGDRIAGAALQGPQHRHQRPAAGPARDHRAPAPREGVPQQRHRRPSWSIHGGQRPRPGRHARRSPSSSSGRWQAAPRISRSSITTNSTAHRRGAVDAARRQRHQPRLEAGADTLRDRLIPAPSGRSTGVDGQRHRRDRHRPRPEHDAVAQHPAGLRVRARPWRSCCCWSRSGRS